MGAYINGRRGNGETDDDWGVCVANCGEWEDDVERGNHESERCDRDEHGGVEDAGEVARRVVHLAGDEAEL
jgi:hypothetical protein